MPKLHTLDVRRCPKFAGLDLQEGLVSLTVFSSPKFTGENMPKVRILDVRWCSNFVGDKLQVGIVSLKVVKCEKFTGKDLPKGITDLVVDSCKNYDVKNSSSMAE